MWNTLKVSKELWAKPSI